VRRTKHLKLVVVAGDDDQVLAVRLAQPSEVPHLPLDHEAAPIHVDRREATVPHAGEQQTVTSVVASEHRRNAVEIPAHQQIRPPVAIEVPHQRSADRRELSLGGKGKQGEGPVPVVQGRGAREDAGFSNRRLGDLPGWENVLDSSRAEIRVGGVAGSQPWDQAEQLVPTGERVAHALFVEREDLLERPVVAEVAHVHARGLRRRRSDVGVEPEVAEDQVRAPVPVQVGDGDAVPPAFRSRKPGLGGPVHQTAILLMEYADRHPFPDDD